MNTRDLVEVISSDSGLTKVQADRALNALATNLTIALRKNEDVYIAGIGTFTTSRITNNAENDTVNASATADNPETADLNAARVPQFQPGTEFLSAVR